MISVDNVNHATSGCAVALRAAPMRRPGVVDTERQAGEGNSQVQIFKLLRQVSDYSLGSLLVTLAGLVSFPILTRVLGVDDYGNMSLVAVTLSFLVAFGKFGLQHSAIMFYSETRAGNNAWTLQQYYPTLLGGMLITGTLVTVGWLIVTVLADRLFFDYPGIVDIFALVAPLILVRVLQSVMNSILRAREHSGTVAIYAVLWRYVNLGLVIPALLLIEASLRAFFIATLVAEVLVLAMMVVSVLKGQPLDVRRFSTPMFRAMLLFGLPMLGYEVAGVLGSMGDRYVIKLMLGAEELGKYSAAYNLCEYVSAIIVASLASAILPMYLRIWSEKGREKTEAFIAASLRLYVFAAFPIAAGMAAVADDFIAIMASPVYREGAVIVPWVIIGMMVDGAIIMLAAGLYIEKKSRVLMLSLAASAFINIALNVVLVPLMGIEGAAIATLASFAFYAWLAWRFSSRHLAIMLPWQQCLRYGVFSLAMYWLVESVEMDGLWLSLVAKVTVGALFYLALVWLLDPESKKMVALYRHRNDIDQA